MALPTDGRQITDILTETTDVYMDDLHDQVYKSNPLLVRLMSKGRVIEGGAQLRQGFIYDKVPGGAYAAGGTFDTSITQTKTQFIWPWTRYYGACNLDGLTEIINQGPYAVVSSVEVILEQARQRISDDIGTDLLQADGTDATRIVGLAGYVNDGTLAANSTYGGITYGTDTLGSSVKAQVNSTGGPFSLSVLNQDFGKATIQPSKPDLILLTQTLWDKLWERVQPSQRIEDPGFNDLTNVGYQVVRFNGADCVVESHMLSGQIIGLNTDYLELITLQGRNMVFEGWFRPANADQRIGQVLWSGNLKGASPRLNFIETSIT